MLNDAQIASIKQRLKLTAEQERMWPAVEAALRKIVYTKNAMNPQPRGAQSRPQCGAMSRLHWRERPQRRNDHGRSHRVPIYRGWHPLGPAVLRLSHEGAAIGPFSIAA